MNRRDAVDTAARILPKYRAEQNRLDKIDRYLGNEPDGPYTPRSASNEPRRLSPRRLPSPNSPPRPSCNPRQLRHPLPRYPPHRPPSHAPRGGQP